MLEYDERVKNLAASNMGSRRIAKELGLNPVTVYKILKRLGLVTSKTNGMEPIEAVNEIKFSRSTKIDAAAETYLIYLCEISGYDYCVPSRKSKYDLLVDFGDGFKKIQVKSSTSLANGKYVFALKTTRHNSTTSKCSFYSSKDVDYFFLHSQDGRSWLIPYALLTGQSNVTPAIRFENHEIVLRVPSTVTKGKQNEEVQS